MSNIIHEILQKRRSTVLFSNQDIEAGIIARIFEAARWSASSRNEQPWRFIYVLKGDENYENIASSLAEFNQKWARNAPMLLISVAKTISDYQQKENRYAWHDTGMAYANLVFQAVHEGLSVHPMGGYDRDQLTKALRIPEGFSPVLVAAIGYKSESRGFSAELLEREDKERVRKKPEEIIMRNYFS